VPPSIHYRKEQHTVLFSLDRAEHDDAEMREQFTLELFRYFRHLHFTFLLTTLRLHDWQEAHRITSSSGLFSLLSS